MTPPAHDAAVDAIEDAKTKDLSHAAITKYFGDPLPAAEAAMWAAMSADRREKAIERLKILAKWNNGAGPLTPTEAAGDADVSLNRWFEMAKAWRQKPSLAALGTFAKSSRRPDPRETVLRQMVAKVLGPYPTGSVRQNALALGEAYEAAHGGKVGLSMLRRVVENELRRREIERRLGNEIQFDCSACSVLRSDETPYTLFAVIDRGSQLVLGAALGDVRSSEAGYAAACRDGLRRIESNAFDDLPWLERVARMELVAGLDAERWANLRTEMAAAGVAAPVEPSTRPNRFGRYLRNAVGERFGRIDMWYGRTLPNETRRAKVAARSPRLEADDAEAFLGAQVDEHNADRRKLMSPEPEARAPTDLLRALRHLAGI